MTRSPCPTATAARLAPRRLRRGRKGGPRRFNESDYTILATYQLEYRGMVNYYRMAYNLHTLQKLKWVMEQSLTKTLAAKHNISVCKVYQKYRAELDIDGKIYKGLQVAVLREGRNRSGTSYKKYDNILLKAFWCQSPEPVAGFSKKIYVR